MNLRLLPISTARALVPLVLFCLLELLAQSGTMPTLQAEEAPTLRVRVLLLEAVRSVSLRGLDLSVVEPETRIELVGPLGEVRIQSENGSLTVNGRTLAEKRLLVMTPAVFLLINGREQRGPAEIRLNGSSLQVILHLPIETYVVGTVGGEMPSSWPLEALKAQVIVARTYAWIQTQKRATEPYDVFPDVRDQVYGGPTSEDVRIAWAARETQSEVLMLEGQPAETYYSSTCGGVTEIPGNVWPSATRTQPSVTCGYCKGSPHARWTATVGGDELAELLKEAAFPGARVTRIEGIERSRAGRLLKIRASSEEGSVELEGNQFRRMVGYNRLKSLRFSHTLQDGSFHFEGQGYGHGAGMCQWGARGMALEKKTADEILSHYFPGTARIRLVYQQKAFLGGVGEELE